MLLGGCLIMTLALPIRTEGARAGIDIAATIAPVHSLVAMVTEGVSSPALIIRPGASPHGYAMKPSEAAALDRAAIVFRIGDHLEGWMRKAIDTLADDAVIVELAAVEGVTNLPVRKDGVWQGHDDHDHHEHDEAAHHEDAHDSIGNDPHLWLDPDHAVLWLDVIAAELAKLDEDHAQTYRRNAEAAATKLVELTASIEERLANVSKTPYIVFHDAYQYFERRFGLSAVGSVSLSDADRPSAKRLAEIRMRVEESGAVCAFSEPQFEPKLLETVIDGFQIEKGILDPMGAEIGPGIELYPLLLERLADALAECLS